MWRMQACTEPFTVMGRLVVAYLICGKEDEMCESHKHQGYTNPHTRNQGHAADKKKKNIQLLHGGPGHMNVLFMYCIICELKHISYFRVNCKKIQHK